MDITLLHADIRLLHGRYYAVTCQICDCYIADITLLHTCNSGKRVANLPMANLQVIIQAKDGIAKTGNTNAEGDVLFDNIDPGRYTVTIKQAGQPDIVMIKEVNTGTAARLEVTIP
jgi:hypothetical protein